MKKKIDRFVFSAIRVIKWAIVDKPCQIRLNQLIVECRYCITMRSWCSCKCPQYKKQSYFEKEK